MQTGSKPGCYTIYIGVVDFSEVVGRITNPQEKAHILQYHKAWKTSTLHFRQLPLKVQDDLHKQNIENEAKEALASSSTANPDNSKDKGKVVLEGPDKPQSSSTLEILHRAAGFKKGLEKLSSEIEA